MSFTLTTAAIVALVAVGAAKATDGAVQTSRAKKRRGKAQIELDKQRDSFKTLDTSNPYLNVENVYEDLTINTKGAEFEKQQSMQSQANILNNLRGAAGTSGIASLAQSLANSGSLDAQKAAAGIAQQEANNQTKMLGEASRLQTQEIGGEIMSRNAIAGKVESLMGMAADDVSNARAEQAAGKSQMYAGLTDIASAGMQLGGGGAGGAGFDKTMSDSDTETWQQGYDSYKKEANGTEVDLLGFKEWKAFKQGNV